MPVVSSTYRSLAWTIGAGGFGPALKLSFAQPMYGPKSLSHRTESESCAQRQQAEVVAAVSE